MEFKVIILGKCMVQYFYDWVQLLNVGVKVFGDCYEYFIFFNQLLLVYCKCGLVWGELEFVLLDVKVVCLYGIEWSEMQCFYYYLYMFWQQWSMEMSDIVVGVLKQQLVMIEYICVEGKWLICQQVVDVQDNICYVLIGLLMFISWFDVFDNCWELWWECQCWLGDIEVMCLVYNQVFIEVMLE